MFVIPADFDMVITGDTPIPLPIPSRSGPPLKEWLGQRQVDLDALQSQVDAFLEQARQKSLEPE
jgi:hypothetical protein